MNGVDGKTIFSAGSYGLFFIIGAIILGLGLYLIFLAAQSMLKAREANRFPTAAFVIAVLAGVLIALPIYPLALLQATNDLIAESEMELVEFVENMARITSRGFTLYQVADGMNPAPDPDATPTPLFIQDGTPVFPTAGPLPDPAEPTATPDMGVSVGGTAVPTVTGVWPTLPPGATATWPVLNPSEGPHTATPDIAALATQNAAVVTANQTKAAPTLNPETWNVLTPVATPVR